MWSVSQFLLRGIERASFYRCRPTSAHLITCATIGHKQLEFFETGNSRKITIQSKNIFPPKIKQDYYKRNSEARSFNQCCDGKLIIVTCSEC